MATRNIATDSPKQALPGHILLVVHDFVARSPDELSLSKGDRIELIERDDDFGDGWYLGRHLQNGDTGLFPEVYTTVAPRLVQSPITQRQRSESSPIEQAETPRTDTSSRPGSALRMSNQTWQSSQTSSVVRASTANASDSPPPIYTPILQQAIATTLRSPTSSTAFTSSSMLRAEHGSPVMNETLNVIDEHITDMRSPRFITKALGRHARNDSGSEYSNNAERRPSYVNGNETDEEEGHKLTEDEVLRWTSSRVAAYLEDIGVEKKHCDVFREQEITGDVLLGMDQASLFIKEFDLGPVGRRLKSWLKIKAFQEEVKGPLRPSQPRRSVSDYGGHDESEEGLPPGSHTINSSNTIDNRGSIGTGQWNVTGSRASRTDVTSPAFAFPGGFGQTHSPASPRPSAASIREFNHSRRHSSMDSKTQSYVGEPRSATMGSYMGHTKQPSYERSWTSAAVPSGKKARPVSSVYVHSLSSERGLVDPTERDRSSTLVGSVDLDRGYFSGGEVEGKKIRNLLRKRESSVVHSRNSSYGLPGLANKETRPQSMDTSRDSTVITQSPASKTYYNNNQVNGNRAISGPQLGRPLLSFQSKDVPAPTVTKLEWTQQPTVDAIAVSPNIGQSSETSSINQRSPSQSFSFFKKGRGTGIRAISDAVTVNEKGLAERASLTKDSPLDPPSRNSSTPSATSKSMDLENGGSNDLSKSTSTSGVNIPAPTTAKSSAAAAAARRKTKKATSAYTRGLQQRTPQEQMVGCDYSGWMKKRSSNLMTTWKPRLFVLRGRRLSYYYSEKDREEKGLIDISGHRVLPANEERLTGIHAVMTGATTSPIPTSLSTTLQPNHSAGPDARSITSHRPISSASAGTQADSLKQAPSTTSQSAPQFFIFKLVPPRRQTGINFTKPAVHYFAVDSVVAGRLWMAALMKATIERDLGSGVTTTYTQKTVSLEKARRGRVRPPALQEGANGGALIEEDGEEKEDDEQGKMDVGARLVAHGAAATNGAGGGPRPQQGDGGLRIQGLDAAADG